MSDINVYAVVTKIEKVNKSFLYNLTTKSSSVNRELQTTLFHDSFKLAKITDEQSIILFKNIVWKCILIKLKIVNKKKYYTSRNLLLKMNMIR